MKNGPEWPALLEELRAGGCTIHEADDESALISEPDSEVCFSLQEVGAWLQLSATLLGEDEIHASGHRSALDQFALEFHCRMLSCRFGYYGGGDFAILHDLYPAMRTAEEIVLAIGHMTWTGAIIHSLLERLLETGFIPDDDTVDEQWLAADKDPDGHDEQTDS